MVMVVLGNGIVGLSFVVRRSVEVDHTRSVLPYFIVQESQEIKRVCDVVRA
jgi:hypothetical protein